MSLEEIFNGMALGTRIGLSVLVECLGQAIFADWIRVAKGEGYGQKQKEMKKVNLKDPFAPFVSLFATQV